MDFKNIKVLYISYDGIFDPVGQSQIIPYLRGLVKKGIDIFLISFEKANQKRKKSFFYNHLLVNKDIRWFPLIYHKKPIIPATLFDIFHGVLKGWILVKKNKIKTIHARGYIAGIIAWILKIFNNIKFIFDMRGFWPEEKVDSGAWTKKGLLYRLTKYLEEKMILGADEIVVLTETAKKFLIYKHNLSNISVIPCCVDLETFSIGLNAPSSFSLPKNRLFIIYIGNTGTFYNFEEMAKFFQIFKRKIPEAFFLILSNNNKEFILETMVKYNIKADDSFVSSVSHEEVPQFLNCSAFSLIFYRRVLSGRGCCPIKFAESLACGVPVLINSEIGDCDRIVKQNKVGVVLKDLSVESYIKFIPEIEDLLQKRKEVAERCRNVAKKYFFLDKGIEKYFSIYQRLRV